MWDAVTTPYVRPTMAQIDRRPRNGLSAVGSFSGCGGSSLGLKMAGWEVRAAIEFIPAAADTYTANFPDATVVYRQDIREIPAAGILADLKLKRGELDLFEGSPPCASFSAAGMRERGWGTVKKYSDSEQRTDDLFYEWERLLEGLYPRAFVAENVPGMESGAALADYAHKITRALGEHGYRCSSAVVNAANYGVPQVRRRLIFVGIRNDVKGDWSWPAPTVHEPVTVRTALESVKPGDPDHAEFLEASSMKGKAVGRTWEWKRGLREKDLCARCEKHLREHETATVTVGSVKKSKGQEEAQRTKGVHLCADGERAIEVKDYFLLTMPDLDRPCPTLTATGAQVGAASVVHPTECRKFTPAEAKALCGFPADFVLTGTREQRYERMGRAVAPPVYEAIGKHLAEILKEK